MRRWLARGRLGDHNESEEITIPSRALLPTKSRYEKEKTYVSGSYCTGFRSPQHQENRNDLCIARCAPHSSSHRCSHMDCSTRFCYLGSNNDHCPRRRGSPTDSRSIGLAGIVEYQVGLAFRSGSRYDSIPPPEWIFLQWLQT